MIGSFEHFGFETYPEFFQKMYAALPDDGRMLLHTIVAFWGTVGAIGTFGGLSGMRSTPPPDVDI